MSPVLDSVELAPGVVVVTVNSRLARFLVREHETMQSLAGERAWVAADILPWSAWLMRCWEGLHDQWRAGAGWEMLPLLLTPSQELLLWERIVADSPEGAGLLRVADAAQKAREAWHVLRAWEIDLSVSEASLSDDAMAWRRWADRFDAELQRHRWCTVAALPVFLRRHVARLSLPKVMHWIGFDRITPQQAHLCRVLTEAGVEIRIGQAPPMAGHAVRVALPDAEAEIRAAASWARRRLEQRLEAGASQEGATWLPIGVVMPGLTALRSLVVRVFREVFLPGEADPALESLPFNLSLGIPLSETPLVRDALLLLDLGRGRLDTSGYGRLLASPFLAGGEREWSARGRLDARLRAGSRLSVTLEQLHQAALQGDGEGADCPVLAGVLGRFLEAWRRLKKEGFMATTRQWAIHFDHWLQLLGWPGERGVESAEFQAVASWQESLAGFAALDRVSGKMGLSEALALLQRHMADTLFQPESAEAPVQILGVLEAQGMQFDGLWIPGLSDDVWPPVPEPNPFLPVSMQRRHGLPKCSSEQELLFARQILDGLLHAAHEVVVSHSRQEGDRVLRLSPLAAHLPEVTLPELGVVWLPDYARLILAAARSEYWQDWRAPACGDGMVVSGGAGLFKSQALCPFQAFGRYRLHARALDDPQPGLNGGQRGELVHLALKQFWTRIGSSHGLAALTPELWEERAKEVVVEVVEEATRRWPEALTRSGRLLEEQRLLRLLAAWTALERSRQADFVVLESEEAMAVEMGGLRLSLRMDRVDRLPDGTLLVLDYKTGKQPPRIRDWFSSRPREPQLPLYALALADQVVGVAFARLFAQDARFIGMASEEEMVPGVVGFDALKEYDFPDWEAVLTGWRGVFADLAQAFRSGEALPDALPGTCGLCDLAPLCRIADPTAEDLGECDQGEES